MARRSNKTTHVLNLIAGSGTEGEQIEQEEKSDQGETSDSRETSGQEEKSAKKTKSKKADDTESHPAAQSPEIPGMPAPKANTPVVKIQVNDHDPLSDMIKDALETEESYVAEPPATYAAEPAGNQDAVSEPVISSAEPETAAPSEKPAEIKEINSTPAIANEIAAEKLSLAQKLEQSQKLHFHDRKDISSMLDLDFKYINVYERIIQDKILEYMRKFDMCMCDRCIVDTFALTLTNLPTKIVVTDRDSVFPMVSYYETKNTAIISTALIKACMMVKDKPHHD